MIEVRIHGNKDVAWGNAFLTDNFVLHIDLECRQHEVAMEELGILPGDVLVSAFFHDDVIAFRGSGGYEDINQEYMKMVKQLIKEVLNERKS